MHGLQPAMARVVSRRRLLATALLLTLLLCLAVALAVEEGDHPEPARAAQRPARALQPTAPATVGGPMAWPELALKAWQGQPTVPAPAPMASTPAPAAPRPVSAAVLQPAPPGVAVSRAPPLAYTLMGRYDDGSGQPQAWLSSPQRLLVVRQGDLVDSQWRVERVQASSVDLLWLHGSERRTLSMLPL